jgi:two-component system aerobic respiration control sensor histidine kinase ArcB
MLAELFGIDAKQTSSQEHHHEVALSEAHKAELDIETITDFMDSMGVDAFKRSTQLFEKLNPKYCEELRAALANDDIDEYSSVAHKLKGAAGSVGLQLVQLQAKKMELDAAQASNDALNDWVVELEEKISTGQVLLGEVVELLA